jgi:C4-dicarboxylate transporter DctM subunit
MALTVFFTSLAAFLIIRIPLAFAMGMSSLLFLLLGGNIPLMVLVQKTFSGTDSFVMLALPLFILSGAIMNVGGIARRLIDCASAFVGHIRGGLALVNIVASMFFGGITGSAVADASALGSVLIPGMVRKGYRADFSAAVTSCSSTIGIIIPPSIPMILYAVVTEVSVGTLFLAGAIPGVLVGLAQMLVAYWISRRDGYPTEGAFSLARALSSMQEAALALLMPVIILGSIVSGICTPTESAGIAVVYGLLVSSCIYRSLDWPKLRAALEETIITTATIMIIIGFGAIVGWIMAYAKVPTILAEAILSVSSSPWVVLLLINLFLLALGFFMHGTPIILIVVPILLPLIQTLGIDLIHFGIIVVVNIGIGQQTPPMATCLLVTSAIAKLDIMVIARAAIPFMLFMVAVLLLITYVPGIALLLPRLLGQ